ncbi:RGS1-HXK1-interacting protein 1-like protein [Drosera capensis]
MPDQFVEPRTRRATMEPPKEETHPNPPPPTTTPPTTTTPPPAPKPWHSFITSHLHSSTTAVEPANSSLRSTLSVRKLQYLQDLVQEAKVKFAYYEGAFFGKIKDELKTAKDHPEIVVGAAVASSFFLMRGPRKFLLRQTLGRFQSEEARFNRAEKNVKELNLSVEIFKKDGDKLLQRADLAEKEMRRGLAELMNAGTHIQNMAKSIYELEGRARDLMDGLREVPGREAIQIRAEINQYNGL